MADCESLEIAAYGDPAILAAAGAAVLAWNGCEFTMNQLLSAISNQPKGFGTVVFHFTNNKGRLEILRYAATLLPAPISDLLLEFATQYGGCNENRNLVAHATLGVDPLDFSAPVLRKMKSGSYDQLNSFPVSADDLLEMANACSNTSKFGHAIMGNILSLPGGPLEGWRTASPEIPPRPRKLNPQSRPNQDSARAQPQSSQALS